MKKKKWLLLLIIAFPSFFWLILETSTINSRRLPHYGPKAPGPKGDTTYHRVDSLPGGKLPPVYAIAFISEQYRHDAYRLTGVWEYLSYKKEKIAHIPVILVREADQVGRSNAPELSRLLVHKNVRLLTLDKTSFEKAKKDHFLQKPYYIDYSFFLLIDPSRHVRGYYDARYVAEIKRLIEEYQHLRLKEEKQQLLQSNEIKNIP